MSTDPRLNWIAKFVAGKRVLDLGCVRHTIEETEKPDWLHARIKGVASEVVGVDRLEDAVASLRKRGYEIECADVETMRLGKTFDVVVAGDLIEHLNNVGNFLERVREHLAADGIFLVSTPNPINPMRFIGILLGSSGTPNPEHTCWYTEHVLCQLLERYGFEAVDVKYVDDSSQYYGRSWKWKPFLPMNSLLSRLRPRFAETLCAAFKLKAQPTDL